MRLGHGQVLDKNYVPYSGKLGAEDLAVLGRVVESGLYTTSQEAAAHIEQAFGVSPFLTETPENEAVFFVDAVHPQFQEFRRAVMGFFDNIHQFKMAQRTGKYAKQRGGRGVAALPSCFLLLYQMRYFTYSSNSTRRFCSRPAAVLLSPFG